MRRPRKEEEENDEEEEEEGGGGGGGKEEDKWNTVLHFRKIKYVGWINNSLAKIYALSVNLETDRYDPPIWLDLLDCKTKDTENEKYALHVSRCDFDRPTHKWQPTLFWRILFAKTAESKVRKKIILLQESRPFASAANCIAQKWQVHW